ncbi:hypothetical protein [Methanolobus sp. ZRKC5]|uniref:hypothetical protein n=2 Tax=unclassified Methanolobus TaxID=2629569 RepID=UPI00313F0563
MKFRKVILTGIIVIIYTCMITTSLAAIPDTTGDFYSPDISSLDVLNNGNNLNIIITCTEDIADYSFYGAVFIDTDQNILTGYAENGADYVYQFSYMSIIYSDPMITTTLNDDMVDSGTLQAQSNTIYITLPFWMLGNDDGNADVFVAVHDQMVKALDFDRAPDYGVIDTSTGGVKIQQTASSNARIFDRVGDGGAADIENIDATVGNGMLNLVITYANNVEPSSFSYGDDITGWVNIDIDQQLATGFTNTEQAPPTFGVDYRIEYAAGSLTGTDAAIKMINTDSELAKLGYSDTTTRSLGVPYNDGTFKVSGNTVYLGIPLTLLGNDDGNMYITVDSFTLQDSLGGDIDSLPDNGNGAIDTSDGSIKALLSYGNDRMTFTDSESDSTGFGHDGDEIVSIETGFDENNMLITVTYSSLNLDDGAITNIFFDMDQDNTEDYSLIYSLQNGKLSASMIGTFAGKFEVKEVTHLITMQGNKMYLSIPSVFLGNDDGNMNLHAETALVNYGAKIRNFETGIVQLNPDEDARTLYDRAPDTGSYTIGRSKDFQAAAENANVPQAAQEEESPGFSGLIAFIALITCLYIAVGKKKL